MKNHANTDPLLTKSRHQSMKALLASPEPQPAAPGWAGTVASQTKKLLDTLLPRKKKNLSE